LGFWKPAAKRRGFHFVCLQNRRVYLMALEPLGRYLIFIGVVIIVIGALLTFFGKFPWVGRLPGDIIIRRENVTIYIPIVTMLILSLILTLFFNLVGRK
jgi:hypothetical protein